MNPWSMIVELENMKVMKEIMHDYADPSKQQKLEQRAEEARAESIKKLAYDIQKDTGKELDEAIKLAKLIYID